MSTLTKTKEIGKRIVDISELVEVFEHQEGEIRHITGKIGQGKTYMGTRLAYRLLCQGKTVYTTWQLILPEYYDERENKLLVFWRMITFNKRFYKFDFKKNWHYLDIDRPDLVEYVANLTDCYVFLDEGQDIFDSYEGRGMSQVKRKSLTRTRHLRKTLIIISQRAQAVATTARANVTWFYKCVKTRAWFWPFKNYFKVYRTEDVDDQNYPIWEKPLEDWKAELYYAGFEDKKIYSLYNSHYLREGIMKSQEVKFEAFDLSWSDKIKAMFSPRKEVPLAYSYQELVQKARKMQEFYKKENEILTRKSKKSTVEKDLTEIEIPVLHLKHEEN